MTYEMIGSCSSVTLGKVVAEVYCILLQSELYRHEDVSVLVRAMGRALFNGIAIHH